MVAPRAHAARPPVPRAARQSALLPRVHGRARERGRHPARSADVLQGAAPRHLRQGRQPGQDRRLATDRGDDAISIVTALCPRAEATQAVTTYQDVFEFCAPESMPSLRTLEVLYGDTENGFRLARLVPLFKVAPNLQRIQCYAVDDEGDRGGGDLGVTLD